MMELSSIFFADSFLFMMYSRLLRCSTARGSSTGLSLVGPTKVKPGKSFYSLEVFLKFVNKEHLFNFAKNNKSCLICIMRLKVFLVKYYQSS